MKGAKAVAAEVGTEDWVVEDGLAEEEGSTLGGWGRCRRRKRVEVGVRKQEIWAEEKESMRRRYLRRDIC